MSTALQPESSAPRSAFFQHKIASILAIAPLGVWTVWHLWSNLAAFGGATEWEEAVTGSKHPLTTLLTMIVVLLPLLIHTAWGLKRLTTSRPNNDRYGYFGNLRYLLQRLSAVGVLLFLGAHIFLAFIKPRFLEGHPEAFADIAHEMRFHGPTLVVYLLGTLGVAYHLANGLQGFAMGWGIATTSRGLKRVERVTLALFVVLLAMSWGSIYALHQAGR